MNYNYVKGYKAPLSSLPKEIREIIKEKMSQWEEYQIEDLMFEVDLYISVDIKNYYQLLG